METMNEFLDKLAREGVKLSVEAGQLNCYAPKGALTPAIRDGIARYRTEIAGLFEARKGRPATDGCRRAGWRVEEFPLSAGQKGLYVLQKLDPAMSAYNVPVCFRIKQGLDAILLAKAWEYVLEQYPILTARVVDRDGALYQHLDEACRTTIQHQSIELADDRQLLAMLKERARKPFDLDRGPLTRIELFTWGGPEAVLLLTIHHLVIDGASGMIVLGTLLECYRQLCEGKPVPALRDLPGYHDFVAWEEAMLASPEGRAHAAYWRKQLEGELPIVELVPDRPGSISAFEGKPLAEQLPDELSQWVREYGRTHSLPASAIFLALFQLLLQKFTDQEDIIVGMPVMGRAGQRFLRDVGYFINMVPLRTRCEPGLKMSELFRRVQATMLDALFHSSYPFPLMLETLQIKEVRKNPVFQVTYAYQNYLGQDTLGPLMHPQTLDIVNMPELAQEGESDLGLEVYEEGSGFSVKLKYNPELYTDAAIRRLFESYCALLKGVSEGSDRPLLEYSIISGPERERVLVDFNETRAEYPTGKCLHEMFVEQVGQQAGKVAVVCGDEQLTYQKLYDRSRDLALYLQSHGVGPDKLVGLCMERSLDMLVGLLGILQAGGAYVPLDPNYPDERVAYTLEDSQAAIVLTQESVREKLLRLVSPETRLVSLDGQTAEIGERVAELKAAGASLRQDVKPSHLAYVIYTSGSTGKPKGVAIEHHSPATLVHWAHEVYSREELAGVLASTSICFDLSIFEMFVTLAGGGTIILVPNALELSDLPNRESVTLINTVPSAMEELVRMGAIPDSVLTVNLAGEPLSPRLVDKVYDNSAAKKVYDLYGPSEDTTYSTYVLRKKNGPQTIGRPIANTRVYILDPQRNIQPIGVPGELYIAGDGLARGYLNRVELTQEKFVANPFEPGSRMYRTGDRARWLDDGNIQYLGRIDTQVKIRGFRIEIGEIEVRLSEHAGVQDCAIVAQGEGAGKQLVAFYRAKETTSNHVVVLPLKELRAHLLQSLPDYMVPAAFVSLHAIPLNPNGKVDRRALARMEVTIASGDGYVAPRNDTEQRLVAMWAEVLNHAPETIGVHDNFFEMGGHSLVATQLISRIHSQMGVDLPLKTVFDQNSIAQLSACIAKAEQSEVPPILPIDRTQFERLPLSLAEERVWFVTQLVPEAASVYSVPGAFLIHGELNLDHMDEAYNLIIARHETLRTIFPIHDGRTHREILDRLDFKFQRTDLSQYDPDARHARATEICLADARTPFDLTIGPLIRGNVMKLAKNEHIVMINMHHIVSDGWSIGVLVQEFRTIMDALRQGRRPELPPLAIQYVDYAVWQRKWLERGGAIEKQLAYWREKLAGLPETLDLATDYPRASVQGFKGTTRLFTLDAQLVADLKHIGERHGATLYMVLLAAFKALLYRYTGQNDICLGSLIANRNYAATEDLIGMFVNTQALRDWVEEDDTFVALLSKVRATCLEAYENQDAPFPKVVEAMQLRRDTATSPLFQVLFFLQSANMGGLDYKTQRYFLDTGYAKYEMSIEMMETPEGLDGSFEYNTDLFAAQTVARMIEHFITMCRAVAGDPTTKICDLDYVGEEEKNRALLGLNAARAEYPGQCLHETFVAQVARHSDRPAIVFGEGQLTYGQLFERSQDLALYLQSLGVGPDNLVGLCMDRSPDMVVGLLGILQAGGAYVPLDPNYPDERLAYMVRDSQAAIVLTQETLREKLRGFVGPETRLVSLDGEMAGIAERGAEVKAFGVSLRQDVKPHHLAYVIYTSGSTGKPKGVAIEHHSPATLVHWAQGVYSREELAGVLASTSICFDLSIFEIFVTLAGGGTIILVPHALGLLDLPNRESVTLINTVPSAMEELVRTGAIPDSVLTVNLAGEPLSARLVDTIYDTTAVKKVYDLYGPSEATTYSTYALRTKNGPQTIGRPIVNTQAYIIDARHRILPVGVPGELYIAGDGLARGYLNRPELTEERFLANPFEPGTRMYKTGDRARWLDDGNIRYLGRLDTQVKVRGFRIEPNEIEARLNEGIGIVDSAVVAQGQGVDKRLIAFYRAEATTTDHIVELPQEELRAHLLRTLPDYMVPAAFVSIAAIPLSSNGKIHRRALEQTDVKFASGKQYVAPRNATEEQLVEIWAEVLKLAPDQVGVYDSFFELGGHSLSAVQMISRIEKRIERSLPLMVIFTTKNLAELAVVVEKAERSQLPPIRPIDRSQFDRLPLSFAEERLWFMSQLVEGATTLYSAPGAFVIHGMLDADRVDEALNLIIARHESLRTVFPSQDGRAEQRILDGMDFRLDRIDLSNDGTKQARDAKAKEICQADAATPFDLGAGPLIRGTVLKLADDEYILMLNMHHIISDGWSVGVLIKELNVIMDAFRQGKRPELPPLPIQYVDYSVWQRRWLDESGDLNRQLAYWREKLAGLPERLDVPTDYPRPSVQRFDGATYAFTIDAQLAGRLKRLAEQKAGTLYMVLLAAFKALLYRYTGQDDICVGSPIANRQYAETEGLIGMFVNTLALRSRVTGEDTFIELLAKVKATCLEAFENQNAPFEKVVDTVHPQRNLAISPLFQVMLILQNPEMGRSDAFTQRYPLEGGISKFDLTMEFTETAEGLAGSIEYCTALYKPETVARMVDHFRTLCQAVTAAPNTKIRALRYLREPERQTLLSAFNDTQAEYPRSACIHQLFAEQATIQPEQTAVVYGEGTGERTLSYRELYDASCDLALHLQSLGVGPDRIVGLCLERSPEMMVGVMGTALAGGAYLPLDPVYPDERLKYMLEDSEPPVVLTQERFLNRIGGLASPTARVIALDGQQSAIEHACADLKAENVSLRNDVQPHNLSYVIYTSGSTGKPKGVMVEHRALVNRVVWMQERYGLKPSDVVLQKTPYSFDVSVWELFWPMMAGATVVFAVPDGHKDVHYLENVINDAKITTLHYVPSMLNAFLDNARVVCPSVRQIFCSGEALDKKAVDAYRSTFPNAALHNLYGPTEAAIDVTAYDCSQLNDAFVPIGSPISNIQIYILDRHKNPQPIGIPGELHIAGDGLARGYLNRPELTDEKFVANPFREGERMYKTGDLARWLDDGNLQYLGRIDTQVKVRGFRIELGEIEARLNESGGIADSAVVAQGDGVDKRLIAFYRAEETKAEQIVELPQEELRTHLLRTLPDYMVPAAFVSVAAIPLSSNGKVDRRALEQMDVKMASAEEYVAPRNATEKQLVEIWAETLKLAAENVGVYDSFFELGGHSLSAVQLISRINKRFMRSLPLLVIFTSPNVAALAKLLAGEETASFDIVIPIQTDGDTPPVFGVPGAGATVLSLQPLAKALGAKRPFYGLQCLGLDGRTSPPGSVEETARTNVAALQKVQARGPYSLIGHSYGGVVAFEMARILLEQGEEIDSLTLLDSIAPWVAQEQYEAALRPDPDSATSNPEDAVVKAHLERLAMLLSESGQDIDPRQVAAVGDVYRANMSCYLCYKPSRLPKAIDVSLYRATQEHSQSTPLPADYGWNQLLPRPIRVHDVEGDHYSILKNVQFHEVGSPALQFVI